MTTFKVRLVRTEGKQKAKPKKIKNKTSH